jgi:hypothetical protein
MTTVTDRKWVRGSDTFSNGHVFVAPNERSAQNFKVLAQTAMRTAFLITPGIHHIKSELSLDEGTYEMANLRERTTGLPFVVFVSQKGNAQHPCRVKISKEPQTSRFFASVSVNEPVELKDGHMRSEDIELLTKWIRLNQDVLLQYWDGDIQYTEDMLEKIKKV